MRVLQAIIPAMVLVFVPLAQAHGGGGGGGGSGGGGFGGGGHAAGGASHSAGGGAGGHWNGSHFSGRLGSHAVAHSSEGRVPPECKLSACSSHNTPDDTYDAYVRPATSQRIADQVSSLGLIGQVRLHHLLKEGLKMRKDDGGTLTPEHRDYLQHKLDAILGQKS